MIGYIVAFVLVIFGIIINKYLTPTTRKLAVIIICIYIILFLGLRYRVGIDTINYMYSYTRVPSWNDFIKLDFTETRFEPGYMLICVICRSITKEFWLLQLVMATITNIGIFIFLYRYSKNPFIGILVYFFIALLYFTTEIMRESAAIAIFLLNYENIKKKRWLNFYLLSLLSISFQYSAIITWFFPFASYLKKVNIIYLGMVIGLLAIMPVVKSLNEMLTIAVIAGRIDETLASAETLNLNWRLSELIKSALAPILALYITYRKKLSLPFKSYVLLQLLFCAGAFSIPMIFSRFANYTTIFICVYIANVLSEQKISKFIRISLFCILLFSQIPYYYRMYKAWIPYESILDCKINRDREHLWLEYFS